MQQSKDNMEHTRLRVESERGDTHRGRGSRPRLWTFTLTLMKQCLSCLISDWAAWWRKGLVFDQWPRHVQRSLPLICRANVISRYRSFATDNLKKNNNHSRPLETVTAFVSTHRETTGLTHHRYRSHLWQSDSAFKSFPWKMEHFRSWNAFNIKQRSRKVLTFRWNWC